MAVFFEVASFYEKYIGEREETLEKYWFLLQKREVKGSKLSDKLKI